MKFDLATITLVIFSVTSALATSLTARAIDSCPINALSCSDTAGDSCCSPKYGLVVLTQQWLKEFGPQESFTMHGLWPDTCSGGRTGRHGCDRSRIYPNLDGILQKNQTLYKQMATYWPSFKGKHRNGEFWSHEWKVHGTCVSTLNPNCYSNFQQHHDVYDYFGTALQLRQKYDLYSILRKANIIPGGSYSVEKFEAAVQSALGVKPMITCKERELEEIRIYFYVENGNHYVHTDRIDNSTCDGVIDYPIKDVRD